MLLAHMCEADSQEWLTTACAHNIFVFRAQPWWLYWLRNELSYPMAMANQLEMKKTMVLLPWAT